MNPAAKARRAAGKLPYEPGGRQATKNDILNIAWMLGMPLDERGAVGELVVALLRRAKFMREALEAIARQSADPGALRLAKTVLGQTMIPHHDEKETTE